MGQTPDQFWRSTPHEFFDACEGWAKANGTQQPERMDDAELWKLMRRHPDKPASKANGNA